jgi:hypothetical protein
MLTMELEMWYQKHPQVKGPKSKQRSAPTNIDEGLSLPMESDSDEGGEAARASGGAAVHAGGGAVARADGGAGQ